MSPPQRDPVTSMSGADRRAADRRVVSAGVVVSAGIHLVVILLYALGALDFAPPATRVSLDSDAETFRGTRLVRILETDASDPSAESPIEIEEEEQPDVLVESVDLTPTTGPVDLGPPVAGEDPLHAAEVFRLRVTDARLWALARPDLMELTEQERMELALAGRLERLNDSIAAVMAAEASAMDWTKTDENGGKWGISPGKLHLGSITIPLPFGFGPNPWQAEQLGKRQARDDDIAAHSTDMAVRASWKERAEAIRQRRDRERERERERRNTRADTTRSRSGGR